METSTLAYIAAAVAGTGLCCWRFSSRPTTYGSADWLPPWKASAKRLFQNDGLLVGDWTGLLPVYYRGGGHILTVAPTGSGKGVAAIVPNLLRHPWIFLIDPGGENTAIAARAWQDKGYEFYCLNPWRMHGEDPWNLPAHAINPLDILDPFSKTFASDADLLADMIVTRSGRENGSTAFFKDEAQSGIRAFLMHIATTEPADRRNLLTLRKYITSRAEAWGELLSAMQDNQAAGGVIAREAAQLERREAQAPEEFSAVLSTMKQDTNFIEDPVMQEALASSSADFAALKGVKDGKKLAGCVLSVVIPLPYLETHAAYARLIAGVSLWTMERPPLARGRVLFVMDEFPALKRMDRIANGLATLRKYRVWLWPVIQNIGQLKQLYAQNWQTFLSNAGLKQFIGAGDLETAQYVSELCGEGTMEVASRSPGGITTSHAPRRLATVEEIMRISDKLQLVFIDNLKPMILRKTPYWHRPELRTRFSPNPYHAGTPPLDARTPFWSAKGRVLRFVAWLMRPAPAVVAGAIFAAASWAEVGVNVRQAPAAKPRTVACDYLTANGVRQFHVTGQPRGWTCAWVIHRGDINR